MAPLRWGIVSAGRISHDFVAAVSILPTTDHQVVAVAARQMSRAQEFAKLHKIAKAYDSYETLAKDSNVDVVYIGCLNPQHLELSKLMLENGKHVLCEKPMTLNLKQTTELITLARQKKLFLMEAVWSRTFPIYKELRKQLDAGVIGEVKNLYVAFGFGGLADSERIKQKETGGGTILDLGIYTLQFQQFVYGKRPVKVLATGNLNEFGIDSAMSAILKYDNGATAMIQTSGEVLLPNEGIIVGTKGIIRVPNFWCPTEIVYPSGKKECKLPTAKMDFIHINSAGLSYEAEEVRQCILKGLTENPSMTLDESLELAELMDTIRKQVGVVYAAD